ncbi:MAG: SPOR domain-containing protein [Pseudomonadota bacterium]
MAFFKFRKAGADTASTPSQPESVEAMRKRAKHRLIGAVVLVLIAVIGFPLLFDTQPRPIAVDIPIEIPDRNKAKPLPIPAQAAATASVTQPAVASAQAPAVAGPVTPTAPVPTVVKEAPPPEPKVVAKAEPKAEPKPEAKPEPKPSAKSDDGTKAKALLEGKPIETSTTPAAASDGRFVVQVGAFADAGKARETRLKVEKAGLKTYTHVAETKEGKRIRVRVGPFATRGEADKAADKIKGLDLPAAILTL